jgi:hypothetical protein
MNIFIARISSFVFHILEIESISHPEDTTNIGYQGYQNRRFSGHKPQTDLNAMHLEAIQALAED